MSMGVGVIRPCDELKLPAAVILHPDLLFRIYVPGALQLNLKRLYRVVELNSRSSSSATPKNPDPHFASALGQKACRPTGNHIPGLDFDLCWK